MTERRLHIPALFAALWLAALLVVTVYIRVHGADSYHYSSDEAMEVYMSQGTTPHEVLQFTLENALHPPLGYVLRHYWLLISQDPSFVRSLSLLFGAATILLYWRIGALLGGTFTGMCAALLAAFSYGCIIQSYIVRNYTLDLFLLSLSYYYYLHWRTSHAPRALLGYACFGILAYLDSFSALFALFCMAAFETFWLWAHKAKARTQAQWILVNLFMGIFAAAFYAAWRSEAAAFAALQDYMHSMLPFSLWPDARFYPPMTLGYLLLHAPEPRAAILQFIAVIALAGFAVRRNKNLGALAILAWLAFAAGTLLFGSGSYPFLGSRHSLWLFPFAIPLVACSLSELCGFVIETCAKPYARQAQCIAAVLLLAGGWALYNPADRFSDSEEYPLKETGWQDRERFLKTLDQTDLIILGRGDVYTLSIPGYNPYRYSDNALFQQTAHLALVPYFNTQILYDPLRYDTHPMAPDLNHLPLVAERLGLLKGINRFVFILTSATAPSSQPLIKLMTCPALRKTTITFPAVAPSHALNEEDILHAPVTVLVVSRQTFFRQVLSPAGKAHSCLGGS